MRNQALVVIGLLSCFLLAVSCGGGGGSSQQQQNVTEAGSYTYKFKAGDLFPIKEGMSFHIKELGGEGEVALASTILSENDLQEFAVEFKVDKNYVLVLHRYDMPFMRTVILSSQLQAADQNGSLEIGAINAITTYLTGLLEVQLNGARLAAKGKVNTDEIIIKQFMSENFTGSVSDFSSLSYSNIQNGVISTTGLFNQRKNRINLLRVYFNNVYDLPSAPTILEKTAMGELFNAFFDESSSSILLSKLSSSNLPNVSSDKGVSLFETLNSRSAFFLGGTGVLSAEELRQVYFEPQYAFNTELLDVFIDTPESFISGVIEGPAGPGTTVVLSKPSQNSTLSLQTVTDQNGKFSFTGVPMGSYKVTSHKPGYFFKEKAIQKTLVKQKTFDINVTISSFALADYIDNITLVLNNNKLRLKDGSITSAKLASNLSLKGNVTVAGSANIGGIVYPTTDGSAGHVLVTDGNGKLSFSSIQQTTSSVDYNTLTNLPTLFDGNYNSLANKPTLFDGNYTSLAGKPTLFSGNYAELSGKPAIPVIGSNTVYKDVAVSITSDWVNTVNPWSDAEVADNLTLNQGSILNSSISGSNAILTDLKVMNSANILKDLNVSGNQVVLSANLRVIGKGNISGLVYPQADGTLGQFLKTDGSGHLSWQTLAGVQWSGANLVNNETIVGNWVNTNHPWADNEVADSLTINAGTITNTPVSGSSGSFTTLSASSNTSLSGTLTVTGQSNISGLKYPTTDGTSGQVLKTDGSGTLSFVSVADSNLANLSNAATARTNLGLGSVATQNSTSVSITGGTITGITDLAIADGGTGAGDATTARTNLGLGSVATQNSSAVSITGGTITGITDLAIADGGTGAGDVTTARTNLGLGTLATQNSANVSVTNLTATGSTNLNGLTVIDNTDTVIMTSGNRIGIGTTPTSYRLTLPNTAGASGMGLAYTWATYSSKRYKEDIKTIEAPLEKVLQLRGVTYKSKKEVGGTKQYGFIAEEIEDVIPEVVVKDDEGEVTGMDYSRIPALNIEAIKALNIQMLELQKQVKELKKQLEEK